MRRCWVVRHEDGEINIFRNKPTKYPDLDCWCDKSNDWFIRDVPEGFLPIGVDPQWEDEEPMEIEITIKLAKPDETIQS